MDYLGVDQLGSGSRARITYVAHVTLAISVTAVTREPRIRNVSLVNTFT